MIRPNLRGVVNQENLSVLAAPMCELHVYRRARAEGVFACRLVSVRFIVSELVITAPKESLLFEW